MVVKEAVMGLASLTGLVILYTDTSFAQEAAKDAYAQFTMSPKKINCESFNPEVFPGVDCLRTEYFETYGRHPKDVDGDLKGVGRVCTGSYLTGEVRCHTRNGFDHPWGYLAGQSLSYSDSGRYTNWQGYVKLAGCDPEDGIEAMDIIRESQSSFTLDSIDTLNRA
jgi:hypothetical protein